MSGLSEWPHGAGPCDEYPSHSAFADTAEYLYKQLRPALKQHGYDSALVTGHGNPSASHPAAIATAATETLNQSNS